MLRFIYVTNIKIPGGDYAVQAFPLVVNQSANIPLWASPAAPTSSASATSFFTPVAIGWHHSPELYTIGPRRLPAARRL